MRGWSLLEGDNKSFRLNVLKSLDLDILCVCETFLRNTESINIEGYTCFNNNRASQNGNSRRGSGGVAVLIKTELLNVFNVEVLDDTVRDILWLKMSSSHKTICVCVCYLPPENSVYHDSLQFFTKL